jgi:tryptophan synthase alpha chain
MLQDRDGQVTEAHSLSAGLDYPGVGPQLSALFEAGRLEVVSTTDDDAVAAIRDLSRAEGILPALEPAHALAALPRILLGRTRGRAGRVRMCPSPPTRSSWWASPAAATRTSPRSSGERPPDHERRAARALRGAGRSRRTGHVRGTNVDARRSPDRGRLRGCASAANRAALIPYVVAGYPDAAGSLAAAVTAIDAGADLLEVGLPYSDPLADGATLQRASGVALHAGATLDRSVALLAEIAAARPGVPLVPMCYANQLLAGGGGATAARRLADAGASGVIVADLTPDEGAPFEAACRDAGLALVYLVAPTTPPDRRAMIAARTGGFLYTVSLVGVTGARTSLPPEVGRYVRAVKAASPVPVAVGFGVSRPAHVRALVRAGADGVIVASALIDALGPDGRDTASLGRLVTRLRAAAAR